MVLLLQGKNIQPQFYFIVWDVVQILEEKTTEFLGSRGSILEMQKEPNSLKCRRDFTEVIS